jgi:hypothetical protein
MKTSFLASLSLPIAKDERENSMQHLPFYSLEDLESSRADMKAFRKNLNKEKHVWPDLTLSGQDIHNAYCIAMPDESRPWQGNRILILRH